MQEELLRKKKVKIIYDTIDIISKRHPDLYYESTDDVSDLVYKYFKEELTQEKKEIVGDMKRKDIAIMLSLGKLQDP